jgi:hypothetical protein
MLGQQQSSRRQAYNPTGRWGFRTTMWTRRFMYSRYLNQLHAFELIVEHLEHLEALAAISLAKLSMGCPAGWSVTISCGHAQPVVSQCHYTTKSGSRILSLVRFASVFVNVSRNRSESSANRIRKLFPLLFHLSRGKLR